MEEVGGMEVGGMEGGGGVALDWGLPPAHSSARQLPPPIMVGATAVRTVTTMIAAVTVTATRQQLTAMRQPLATAMECRMRVTDIMATDTMATDTMGIG